MDAHRRRIWINRLKLLGALALATSAITLMAHRDPPPLASPGAPMPALSLLNLDGSHLNPSLLSGRVVILNFWATWCPSCRAELPDLVRFSDSHHTDCLQMLGISTEDAHTVARFAQARGLTYPMALSDGSLEQKLAIEVIPTTLVLSPDGHIAARLEGPISPANLDRLIRPLLPNAVCSRSPSSAPPHAG